MSNWIDHIHVGDCRELMRQMISSGVRVNCIVTSPPYFGLRDYGHDGQIGLEASPVDYVETMREVFSLARELLADDGTLWLNLGDSYAGSGRGGHVGNGSSTLDGSIEHQHEAKKARGSQLAPGLHAAAAGAIGRAWVPPPKGLKQKDLVGIPWRVAFALQADGWYLRSDIIWHKPNPMPESVTDRPTKAHEYVFLFSKLERYHYDEKSIRESAVYGGEELGIMRGSKVRAESMGRKPSGNELAAVRRRESKKRGEFNAKAGTPEGREPFRAIRESRNARSVWTIPTCAFHGSHFATFPRDLVRRCILAGAPAGGVVLDPFMGSGTVAEVALNLGRRYVGCELNPEYAAMFKTHRSQQQGMAL